MVSLPGYVEDVQTEIELRQMKYFLAIAEERSFTRASKRCHVALSSLSRQIRAMEVGLNAQLFERLPRETRLTDAGRVFEKEASKALEHSRRAVSRVQALKREKDRTLRIGLSTLCDLPRARVLMETARKSTLEVHLESVTGYTPELLLSLYRGKLDLIVLDLPVRTRGIQLHPICSEPLIAILPQKHPLAQRPIVRLFEFKRERIVFIPRPIDPGSLLVEDMLRRAGMEASSFSSATSLIELLDHVALHRSVGLMRKSASRIRRDDVLYKPLSDSIQLETAMAWRRENRSSQMLSFRDGMITFGQKGLFTRQA